MGINNSDPHQKLMFSVWAQALNDINRLFLLEEEVITITNEDKIQEVKDNAEEAMDWINNDECGTFQLLADLFNVPMWSFKKKTLDIIEENKKKIKSRSKITNQYMYATVSRFRNYEEAFKRASHSANICNTSGN